MDKLFDNDKTFKDIGVCDELLEVLDQLNYKRPTKIQSHSLPETLNKKDVIALAETGSGKTLAFILPIIQSLLKESNPFSGLVLCPTRELCMQINEHFQSIGGSLGLKSIVIVGGLDTMSQAVALLNKKPHVIIATPGRILFHLENTKGFNMNNLKFFVMDEADKLLNMDFEKPIDKIVSAIPKNRQTLLFSATMTNKVSKLQRATLISPVKIEVSNKNNTVETLTQNYIFIPHKDKDCYLVYLLTNFSSKVIIIFTVTCKESLRVCLILRNLGFKATTIHGQMSQQKRIGALNRFKSKELNILVATDVAARGLDISNVDLVLNFDLPMSPKEYLHRVGRTARAGKMGLAINFVTQYNVEIFQKIEHYIKAKLQEYKVEEKDAKIFQERVEESQKIANFEIKKLLDKHKNKLDLDIDFKKSKNNKKRKRSFNN